MIRRGRGRGTGAALLIAVLLISSGAFDSALGADQGTADQGASAPATPGGTAAPTTGAAGGASSPTAPANPLAAPGVLPTLATGVTATTAPPVGVAVRLGNVGGSVAAANALGLTAPARAPGLTITPSLGIQGEYTSNALNTSTDERSDFIGTVTPGLLINLSTPYATGTLSYAPSLQWYANNSSQNNVNQFLNGALNATLLPRTLLLSINAYVTEQRTVGGVTPGGVTTFGSQDTVTTSSFSFTPTFTHRFGDIGTLNVIYSLQYTNQGGNSQTAPGATLPFFVASRSLANLGSATFTTGPFLGRFNNTLSANATIDSGTGILNTAHQYMVTDTLRYALLRRVYVFGTLGYENIFYPSSPVFRLSDGVWAVGLHLTPPGNSDITLGYGSFFGLASPFLRATIALSPRTTLALVYTNVLGTQAQLLQSAVASTTVDAFGNPIDNTTNVPVLLTNQLLSVQSSLVRQAQFSGTITSTWPRDTFSLSVLDTQQKLIANAPGTTGFSQNSWSLGVSWSHRLTPDLTAVTYGQYGAATSQGGSGLFPVYAAQFGLVDRLTPTLFGSLTYALSNTLGSAGASAVTNSVVLALQKTF